MISEKTKEVKVGSKVVVTVNGTLHKLAIVPPDQVNAEITIRKVL